MTQAALKLLRTKTKPFLQRMQVSTPALETIATQTDGFGAELEAIVAEIQKAGNDIRIENVTIHNKIDLLNITIRENKYANKIEDLVFKRLGLKIEIHTDIITHGAMLIFPVTENSILLKDAFKGHDYFINLKKISKIADNDVGTIDLNKAVVGGIFSKFVHPLYVSFGLNFYVENLTPGEVTGILLHELGHAFTFYEYSNRLTAVNQVMATVVDELKKPTVKRNYTYVYNEMSSKLKIDQKVIDDIMNSTDESIISEKLFAAIATSVVKESSMGKYEETSSEQLADQFASRFGYGRQLIAGLDKLHEKYSPERNDFVRSSYYFSQLIFILSGAFLVAAAASIPIISISYLMIFVLVMAFSGEYTRDMTYDDLLFRYTRIRQDAIQQLKNQYYTGKDAKQVIESIKVMDEKIRLVKPFAGLIRPIMNILIPANWKTKQEIQYQQFIELLVNNDLFLKAAELQTLA